VLHGFAVLAFLRVDLFLEARDPLVLRLELPGPVVLFLEISPGENREWVREWDREWDREADRNGALLCSDYVLLQLVLEQLQLFLGLLVLERRVPVSLLGAVGLPMAAVHLEDGLAEVLLPLGRDGVRVQVGLGHAQRLFGSQVEAVGLLVFVRVLQALVLQLVGSEIGKR
jgi:hypothetical protein